MEDSTTVITGDGNVALGSVSLTETCAGSLALLGLDHLVELSIFAEQATLAALALVLPMEPLETATLHIRCRCQVLQI